MRNQTVLDERIIDLITGIGFQVRSYSGRGMYGQTCLGIEVTNDGGVAETVADICIEVANDVYDTNEEGYEEARALMREFENVFSNVHVDNLGLGFIIYFPHIAAPKENS